MSEPEGRSYPLNLVGCTDCALVQITKSVPPESPVPRVSVLLVVFRHHASACRKRWSQRLIAARDLDANSLAVEIASNDGYLLQYYKQAGVPVLGIEPAVNIAKVAEEKGIRTICEFFGEDLARQLVAAGRARRRDPRQQRPGACARPERLRGGHRDSCSKTTASPCIEAPYVKDMIDHVEFDTIYHEHLCYFSLTALDRLFRRHDLVIHDVERLPIHGGSLRIFAAASLPGQRRWKRRLFPKCTQLLAEEAAWGVDKAAFYGSFGSASRPAERSWSDCCAD